MIDSAAPGSVVWVKPGSYVEDLHIDKPVRVKGNQTHLYGHITIAAERVVIDGMAVEPADPKKPAIDVLEPFASVLNSRLTGSRKAPLVLFFE